MRGINLLNKHGVEWNAMAVVNDFNGDYPLDFYHFFKDINCKYIQFTPIVERIRQHEDGRILASPDEESIDGVTDFSVSPEQWGNFLCTIFDEWVRNDVGEWPKLAVMPELWNLMEMCTVATILYFLSINWETYTPNL